MSTEWTYNKDALLVIARTAGRENAFYHEPMKEHTTMKTGGPADLFVRAVSEEQVKNVVSACNQYGVPLFVMGSGSNLLAADEGISGVVLCMTPGLSSAETDGTFIRAESGIAMTKLSRLAASAGLSGLEFAAGIPGTLGGGIYMNAGAYGGEMSQVLREVTWLRSGKTETVSADELELGYRSSILKKNGAVVLSAVLSLKPDSRAAIEERMEDFNRLRREKQPLEYPSAGSTFKRPEKYFAGKLIQDAGLSGFRVGGACVSQKHCGFVINDHDATSKDVIELCRRVEETVEKKSGVKLQMEICRVGRFPDDVSGL